MASPVHVEPSATTSAAADCYVGVKPFERALLAIYESKEVVSPPCKTKHPLLLATDNGGEGSRSSAMSSIVTRWDELHPKLHPLGAGVPESRAPRKCWQLESCIAIAILLAEDGHAPVSKSSHASEEGTTPRRRCHLVDFAGGCGPLGLPLAAMLPWATVTIVELKKRSLDIARERASAAGLTNVAFFEGDIRAFPEPFDVGLALHACGDASDLVMEACVNARARFVVCPCCTGKLSTSRVNVFRYAITQSNETRITYPRSAPVRACLDPAAYDYLACAADVSDAFNLEGPRGVLRRLCKSYLEHDRQLWAAESGYTCHVTRMHRPEATPKADILYGWTAEAPPRDAATRALLSTEVLDEAYADALRLGFGSGGSGGHVSTAGAPDGAQQLKGGGDLCVEAGESGAAATSAQRLGGALGASEWTEEELANAFADLKGLMAGESRELRAPSARRRRLVHYAASELGLHHVTTKKAVRVTAAGGGGGGTQQSLSAPKEDEEPVTLA